MPPKNKEPYRQKFGQQCFILRDSEQVSSLREEERTQPETRNIGIMRIKIYVIIIIIINNDDNNNNNNNVVINENKNLCRRGLVTLLCPTVTLNRGGGGQGVEGMSRIF